MDRKSIIFGLSGTKLTSGEERLIKEEKPWGIILFSRNIDNLYQTKKLIKKIKKIVKDKFFPILIDQEGGEVSRINKIIDLSIFSQNYFGNFYTSHSKIFDNYYNNYIDKVSDILNYLGININTVPVLDVFSKHTHNIIGTRSFSNDYKIVNILGKKCIKNFHLNKIGTVIKHIPGHGLSKIDTHKNTGVITVKKNKLVKRDFVPFANSKSIFAMTAHIIYKDLDPLYTATHSKNIIENVIRGHIGFKGLLISDDISMKALRFDLKTNATKALEAGCNLVLHCNGKIKEMIQLARLAPKIDNFTKSKTSQFYKFLR